MSTDQEVTVLIAALDHAWRRFSGRISNAYQILNFYLVSVAILSAAFVGALDSRLDDVASVVGIVISIVSVASGFGFLAQILYARSARVGLASLESRLMAEIATDSSPIDFSDRPKFIRTIQGATYVALVLFGFVAVGGIAAAVYAWARP